MANTTVSIILVGINPFSNGGANSNLSIEIFFFLLLPYSFSCLHIREEVASTATSPEVIKSIAYLPHKLPPPPIFFPNPKYKVPFFTPHSLSSSY